MYYSFFDLAERGESGLSDLFLDEGPEGFMEETAHILTAVKSVPDIIKGLRGIDRQQKPDLYDYVVQFILDNLKYRIPKASEKTGPQRMIERRSRKSSVQEIPNLLDLINAEQG